MICRNCQTEVDDDLIFCTNCGERLFQTQEAQATVVINEPRATQPANAKPPKSSSNLKWVALIAALIAIPASIFGIFLLRQSQNRQVSVNASTPTKTVTPAPTRKANTNQNANANASNANRANANANAADGSEKTEVMNERIEIAAKEHYAVPFEVEKVNARLKGKVTVLEGEQVEVFVYIKTEYETYFPDPLHKVFSFETKKTENSDQLLVEQEYVLVFVNKSDKPLVIQGNFFLE